MKRNAAIWKPCAGVAAAGIILLAGCGKRNGAPPSTTENHGATESAATDWKVEREQIRKQAISMATERAWNAVSPQDVAAEHGFSWPVEAPKQALDAVTQAVEQQIAAKVEAKYPASSEAAIRKEIADSYDVIEIGDTVDFVIRGGRGSGSHVKGTFVESSDTHIKVDSRWILKRDLPDKILYQMDPEAREREIEKAFRAKRFLFMRDRSTFEEATAESVARELYDQAGYTKVGDEWVAKVTRLEQLVQQEVERRARALRPDVEAQLFTEAGFVLKDGTWQPSAAKSAKNFFR